MLVLRPVIAAFVLAAFSLLSAPAHAQQGGPGYEAAYDVPARPRPARLVNDFAGTLSAAERDALERKLVAFDDSTGSQIAVVIVPSTDGVAPVDYATEVLRSWGVGRADVNDGVVLLVAVQDRDVFIATGFGAEGALTDATAGTIIRSIIVPRFRQGAFYAGIDEATTAIEAALTGQFEPPSRSTGSTPGAGGEVNSLLCMLFIIFVILVVLSSRTKTPPSSGGSGGGRRRRSGPGVIFLPGFGGGGGGFGGGSGLGGGGFGGGGFGGFGGGFGGGGGAGGSW